MQGPGFNLQHHREVNSKTHLCFLPSAHTTAGYARPHKQLHYRLLLLRHINSYCKMTIFDFFIYIKTTSTTNLSLLPLVIFQGTVIKLKLRLKTLKGGLKKKKLDSGVAQFCFVLVFFCIKRHLSQILRSLMQEDQNHCITQ